MKKHLLPALRLTIIFIVICSAFYPLLIAGIAKFSSGGGKGERLIVNGRVVGYANIGQRFDQDKYFWGRPSAVGYNAAGSGGSNKGTTNPDYLKVVQTRIDNFLMHNPGIKKEDIPAELVTYSGSGLDPDISPGGASVQIKRIATARKITESALAALVDAHIEHPLLGFLGPAKINVLKLNVELDKLKPM